MLKFKIYDTWLEKSEERVSDCSYKKKTVRRLSVEKVKELMKLITKSKCIETGDGYTIYIYNPKDDSKENNITNSLKKYYKN